MKATKWEGMEEMSEKNKEREDEWEKEKKGMNKKKGKRNLQIKENGRDK